jgi:cytoskeleton protein RodZ
MTEIKTTEENEHQLPEAPPQVTDFGAPLKRAREAAGYSIAEVSDQLKLSADLLQALESSQLDELPAATFTQGYLRNYARLLKLPADDIVQAYNRQVPTVEPDLTPRSGLPAQTNSHDAVVKIISYGLLVIGLLLLALWWQQADLDWINEPSPEQAAEPFAPARVEMAESDALREAMGESTEQVEARPDQALTSDSTELAPADPTAQQPVDPEQADTEQVPEPEPEPQPVRSQPSPADSKPPVDAVAAEGNDELEISTQSESWTEIQGADGNRLLFKLLQQGQNHRIKGNAPFRVFLGNAPSVAIQMNGQSIDISAYIRSNNIANFVINEDASISSSRESSSPEATAAPTRTSQPTGDDSSRDLMFDEGR